MSTGGLIVPVNGSQGFICVIEIAVIAILILNDFLIQYPVIGFKILVQIVEFVVSLRWSNPTVLETMERLCLMS